MLEKLFILLLSIMLRDYFNGNWGIELHYLGGSQRVDGSGVER